ncbi:FecR family protein [Longitalea luteola]|uniref:FecR family protein n=1 Tax=Longitalea luteola TaxID=2812563 RepID=UPI001A95B5BF|nr:FecR family protein [Longitalea luteola]
MNDYDSIADILSHYPDLTQEQRAMLQAWLAEDVKHKIIFDNIVKEDNVSVKYQRIEQLKLQNERSWEKLNALINGTGRVGYSNWWHGWRMVAAASVIFLLAFGGFLWFSQIKKKPSVAIAETKHTTTAAEDVAPGSAQAKLILGDGTQLNLDSSSVGKVAEQAGVTITNENGQVTYINRQGMGKKNESGFRIIYNTLETSKGQTFSTKLSDGTKVWLNSEASITYPVNFSESERRVVITGEAYFEVAKSDKPFIVANAAPGRQDWSVQVLGTHFNINAYSDEEAVRTTLLEGKVKMTSGTSASILMPGQQAQLHVGKRLLKTVDNVDVDHVIAWKNGYFHFDNENIRAVMKKIARWYDMEVVYKGPVSSEAYGGRIKRNSKLSEVLALLEQNSIHFSVEGKKIIVN